MVSTSSTVPTNHASSLQRGHHGYETAQGVLLLTIAMILAGTIGVFVAFSHQPPLTIVWYRCVIGAVCILGYCFTLGLRKSFIIPRTDWLLVFFSSLFLFVNWIFLFSSYSHTSISVSTVIYNTQPFWVLIFSAIFFRQRIRWQHLVLIGVAFLGIIFLTRIFTAQAVLTFSYVIGILEALCASLMYGLITIVSIKLHHIHPAILTFYQTLIGVACLTPVIVAQQLPLAAALGNINIWIAGIFHTAIMYLLMYTAYRKLETVYISVLAFIYPVVTIIADVLIFHRKIHQDQCMGIMCIGVALVGLVLVNRRSQKYVTTAISPPIQPVIDTIDSDVNNASEADVDNASYHEQQTTREV